MIKNILLSAIIFCCSCSPAVVRDSDDYAASYNLLISATGHLHAGDYEQARAVYQLSNEIIESPEALDGLGCVYFLQGDFEKAQAYFIKAYNKDNNYYNALGNLALLYDVAGMKSEANELYKRALEGDPKNYRIHNNFAALLYDNSNRETDLREKVRNALLKAKNLNADQVILDNLKKTGEL